MTEYLLFTCSILLGLAAGVGAHLLARKRLPGAARPGGGDGAMLRTLIDNLPDLIYVKDVDGRFLLANVAVAPHHGREEPDASCSARTTSTSIPRSWRRSITRTSRR